MHNVKLYLVIAIMSLSNWYLMKSKVKIRPSILKVIYPRLVIVMIYFYNWYLMKSKVKVWHSIPNVIYPRGIFS